MPTSIWPTGSFVPTAEVGVPETIKVDGSFCRDAYTSDCVHVLFPECDKLYERQAQA